MLSKLGPGLFLPHASITQELSLLAQIQLRSVGGLVRYRHVSREMLVKQVAHEEQLRFSANGLRNLVTVHAQLNSSASGTRPI